VSLPRRVLGDIPGENSSQARATKKGRRHIPCKNALKYIYDLFAVHASVLSIKAAFVNTRGCVSAGLEHL
jgi:hypothetical protein